MTPKPPPFEIADDQDPYPMKNPDKLDKKFAGIITKVKDDSQVPADQWVVFLAKDDAFAGPHGAIYQYLARCIMLGCDKVQIGAVEELIRRIELWRAQYPERCKKPDAKGERMIP